jgi:diacylglycerol O-acyltransferase / wax synthase
MGPRGDAAGERLSAADASNVWIDAADQVNVFLLTGVLGPGGFVGTGPGGEPDLARLRADLAGRLREGDATPGLRRFSQRVGGRGGTLRWEACPPDLDHHVRLVAPAAGREGLAGVCASLMSVPLPPDRPLWELLVVPGASPDGPGMVLRVHHAIADGAAGVGLVQRLFGTPDAAPDAAVGPMGVAPASDEPGQRPAGARWRRWGRRCRSVLAGTRRMTALVRRTVPPTVLLGPISPDRQLAFTSVDLNRLHRAAHAAGATVNDALLSSVTVAVEAGLQAVGAAVPQPLPASIPVALPDRHGSGNAVGVMMVPLPTGEPDGDRRLAAVSAMTSTRRAEARRQGTLELTRSRWGSRAFARLARRQRFVALFVTNVPGPARTLSVAGAPLVEAWPVAQVQGNVRLGVSAMSYAGRLQCTVHVAGGAVPADVVAAQLGEELARITARAAPRS